MNRIALLSFLLTAPAFLAQSTLSPRQPALGHRSVPIITVDGLQFKGLNRNGKLDAYEDWRLPAAERARDLVSRMTLEEMAGLMVHGTLPTAAAALAILTNVKDKTAALIANFGIDDTALLDVLTGKARPEGHLPFELPSSVEAVKAQKSDVPHDSPNPLYPLGFGLS